MFGKGFKCLHFQLGPAGPSGPTGLVLRGAAAAQEAAPREGVEPRGGSWLCPVPRHVRIHTLPVCTGKYTFPGPRPARGRSANRALSIKARRGSKPRRCPCPSQDRAGRPDREQLQPLTGHYFSSCARMQSELRGVKAGAPTLPTNRCGGRFHPVQVKFLDYPIILSAGNCSIPRKQ